MSFLSMLLLFILAVVVAISWMQYKRNVALETMRVYMWRHLSDEALEKSVKEALAWRAKHVFDLVSDEIEASASGSVKRTEEVRNRRRYAEEDFYIAYDQTAKALDTLGRGKKLLTLRDWRVHVVIPTKKPMRKSG